VAISPRVDVGSAADWHPPRHETVSFQNPTGETSWYQAQHPLLTENPAVMRAVPLWGWRNAVGRDQEV